jgi:hypothetical protein
MTLDDNIPLPTLSTVPDVESKPKRSHKPLDLTIDSIRQAFAVEICELLTAVYGNSTTRLDYTFEGKPYHVQCYGWFIKGSRPHVPRVSTAGRTHKRKYNRENIAELFKNEGCEFVANDDWTYESNQQPLTYKYQDKEYTTTINRFVNFGHRPHINTKEPVFPADILAALRAANCKPITFDKKTSSVSFSHGNDEFHVPKHQILLRGITNLITSFDSTKQK